jgi:LPXTG-site transpeptidase (sortase) family protein
VIYYRQNKYLYEIDEIEVISPNEIDVLRQTPNDKLTLITCTPIGTNINRLIVHAKPIAINDKPITEKILR